MAKRNRQAGMAPNQAARTAQNQTATEFAAETNAAEVRRQNQQSAERAAAQAPNPTE